VGGGRLYDDYSVADIGSQDVEKFYVVEHPDTEKAEVEEIQFANEPLITGELSMFTISDEHAANEAAADKLVPTGEKVFEGMDILNKTTANGGHAPLTKVPGMETPVEIIEAEAPSRQSEDKVLIEEKASFPTHWL